MAIYRAHLTCLIYALLGLLPALALATEEPRSFNIRPQALAPALLEFSQQADEQVLGASEVIGDLLTAGVSGRMSPYVALNKLLEGTGLAFTRISDRTIRIRPLAAAAGGRNAASTDGAMAGAPAETQDGLPAASARAPADSPGGTSSLEEVVVTAQKREERLIDVPVPVAALSASALVDENKVRLEDYYNQVPGLALATDNRGAPAVSIRGISTGIYANPTVGIAVDGVPFGGTTYAAYSWATADMDPNELSRIEVLRGPQGTLYGVNSIGGLINYVTLDPSMSELSGRLQIGGVEVKNGDQAGYSVNGAVNIPVSDTLAVRMSAFTRLDPGYIDNVVAGQHDVNWGEVSGGHLAAVWRPTSDVSLKISALIEDNTTHGSDYVDPSLGDLKQALVRDIGGYDRSLEAYSAIMTYQLGPATLKSITGYGISKSKGTIDFSSVQFLQTFSEQSYGVDGATWRENNETKKFSEELRFETPITKQINWLLGFFYTDENSSIDGGNYAVDPPTGAVAAQTFYQTATAAYRGYAAFTDLTFHFTENFSLQVGGRESRDEQTYHETDIGPLVPDYDSAPSPYTFPVGNTTDRAFTYLATPQLKLTPDVMIYARLASGYRPGGPNIGVPANIGIALSYAPDKTENYELGLKGEFLNHSLTIDSSVYYIDWKNIQINLTNFATGLEYTANEGSAKSQGVELSVQYSPFQALKLGGWISLNDAVLTTDFPADSAEVGASGDRLPYSGRFSGNGSLDYAFAPIGAVTFAVGATASYVGSRKGEFAATSARQELPAYTETDLRAEARVESWRVRMFCNNVEDERGLISGGVGSSNPAAFTIIRPRIVGLSVTRTF
jgi:outer membrane receptor protein involved in Fe transport